MSAPWPAPNADEQDSTRGRHPNYVLRRLAVGGGLVAAIAAIAFVIADRGGADDADGGSSTPRWNSIVTQDLVTNQITVADETGAELRTIDTDLVGLGDVGLVGTVLVGEQGDTSADGVGILDLETGTIRSLRLTTDLRPGAVGQPFRVGYDETSDAVELLDVRRGVVTDLLEFTTDDDPVVLPDSVRPSADGSHVAFTELKQSATIVVDLESSTSFMAPGAFADMAFGSVVTFTNRGDTVLLDRYDLTGERTATVETPSPAAFMLVDESTAVLVAGDGSILLVDFDDETTSETGSLATRGPAGPATSADTGAESGADTSTTGDEAASDASGVIAGGAALVDHTRLIVFGTDFVSVIDGSGDIIGSLTLATGGPNPTVAAGPMADGQHCALVSSPPRRTATLVDARTATEVGSFGEGTAISQSADGCTVMFDEIEGAGVRVVGADVDIEMDRSARTVSRDGGALLRIGDDGVTLVTLDGDDVGDEIAVTDGRAFAVFATR